MKVADVTDTTFNGGAVSDPAPSAALRVKNRLAIQAAVDSLSQIGHSQPVPGGVVYFPPGNYGIDGTIEFDTGIVFQGANVSASIVNSNNHGAAFGKRGLPGNLTRAFHVYFRDLQITNLDLSGKVQGGSDLLKHYGSVGIDFTDVSQSGINTVKMEYMTVGIDIMGKGGANNGAYYLDLYSPLISTVYIGIRCSSDAGSANDNHCFGGRICDVITGIELNNVNNFQVNATICFRRNPTVHVKSWTCKTPL